MTVPTTVEISSFWYVSLVSQLPLLLRWRQRMMWWVIRCDSWHWWSYLSILERVVLPWLVLRLRFLVSLFLCWTFLGVLFVPWHSRHSSRTMELVAALRPLLLLLLPFWIEIDHNSQSQCPLTIDVVVAVVGRCCWGSCDDWGRSWWRRRILVSWRM